MVPESDDRVQVLVRAGLPLEQRVDAPAAVDPEPDAPRQKTRVEFDDVFGYQQCHPTS